MSHNVDVLASFLDVAGVRHRPLSEPERAEIERQWRAVYGEAFRGRPRLRRGIRAEAEYARQPAGRWLVVPLSAGVAGTPVTPSQRAATGYACEGPPAPLGAACDVEFAVSPADLSWTMLHTHEDHGFGGPYFIRREWIPANTA